MEWAFFSMTINVDEEEKEFSSIQTLKFCYFTSYKAVLLYL